MFFVHMDLARDSACKDVTIRAKKSHERSSSLQQNCRFQRNLQVRHGGSQRAQALLDVDDGWPRIRGGIGR